MLWPDCMAAAVVMAGTDSGGSLALEWVCLTLTENTACAAAAAHSPPRPSPAPQRTAAESRSLAGAHSRAAAALEGRGRESGGGRMAGMPVSPEGEEGRRWGGWSRGAATRHSPIGRSRSGATRAAWVSRHEAAPSPRSRAPGCAGLLRRRVGWGCCSLRGV